jgi:hypothetical protein
MKRILAFLAGLASTLLGYYHHVVNKAKPFLQKEIPAAIGLVQVLKSVIESPVVDLLTGLTQTKVDDVIAAKLRELLPVVLVQLGIAKDIVAGASNDEIIQAAIEHLKKLKVIDDHAYGRQLLEVASALSHALVDGKISLAELRLIVEAYYRSKVKPVADSLQLKAAA